MDTSIGLFGYALIATARFGLECVSSETNVYSKNSKGNSLQKVCLRKGCIPENTLCPSDAPAVCVDKHFTSRSLDDSFHRVFLTLQMQI